MPRFHHQMAARYAVFVYERGGCRRRCSPRWPSAAISPRRAAALGRRREGCCGLDGGRARSAPPPAGDLPLPSSLSPSSPLRVNDPRRPAQAPAAWPPPDPPPAGFIERSIAMRFSRGNALQDTAPMLSSKGNRRRGAAKRRAKGHHKLTVGDLRPEPPEPEWSSRPRAALRDTARV